MKKNILFLLLTFIVLTACNPVFTACKQKETEKKGNKNLNIHTNPQNIKTIYLAGGCFWGVEAYFQKIKGIVNTDTGYANGKTKDTSYEKIKDTDHSETVKIDYDFSLISLEEILLHYFRIIDPVSLNKQGNDIGRQYRTGVYYIYDKDIPTIEKIFAYQKRIYGNLAVEKMKLKNFIKAEDFHQDYLKKNPRGYCHINLHMANEPLFKKEYKNPNEEHLKKTLDKMSYSVLRKNGTERPGSSTLNDEHRKGIYVDKITGEPLFASKDKFDAGCGWPSFSKPILNDKTTYLKDQSHGMERIEVRSNGGDNHLGHVFTDGLKEKGGLRYCINGASLTFIPYEEMEKKGYGEYMILCE